MKGRERRHRKGVGSGIQDRGCQHREEEEFIQTSIGQDIRHEIELRFSRSQSNATYVFPRASPVTPSTSSLHLYQLPPQYIQLGKRTTSQLHLRTLSKPNKTLLFHPVPKRKKPSELSFFHPQNSKSRLLIRKKPTLKSNFAKSTEIGGNFSLSNDIFRRKAHLSTTLTDSLSTSLAVDCLDTSTTSSSASQYLLSFTKFLL